MIEKLVKKNKIYQGKAVDFYCDEVSLPNGQSATREYLGHPGAAAVLPFLDKNNIVLVKQYRYPIDKITYEIPAGKLDKGETPIECIKRELEEETGLKAKRIEKLISFYPTTAFSNEILHIFAAFGLKKGKTNPDADEFISGEIIKFKEALDMVKSGEIMDSKTVIALLYFENILK
ncbi:MAG: NUDIX hydrolase [Endomicrobia bacterium]|nr:NUDIX hydrolase [Endomicrobiia bacterium]MCL2507530.1 NUDIX hydrolase [Endomicrobiia bacterium]